MRRFDPVQLPPEKHPQRGVSVTLAGKFNACPRSAFLYLLHDGGVRSHEMLRGSALHRIAELSTTAMLNEGEGIIPPEIVKAIANEVFADPEYAPPVEEQDYVREMAYRWARETSIEPDRVVACETLFELDLAGVALRAKIDYAELSEDGTVCRVDDLKSSRAMAGYEELGRKRPDGTVAAKSFQLVCYALVLAFGVPVRVEEVPVDAGDPALGDWVLSPRDTLRREVREPFPVASTAQRFDLSYVYPGIEINGEMGRRTVSLTRLELEEYRASVGALLVRFQQALESGDWPAVPGSHCAECPAMHECPLAHDALPQMIGEPWEAEYIAAALHVQKADHAKTQKALRAWAKAHGEIRFGRDLVMEFVPSETERIDDKEAMFAAIERQRLYGEPFDRSEFVKKVVRTDFRVRRLTEDEMSTEGSNASDD